ncbi:MAG: NifB/NifX family molybdenum-iron cluster-binding protein [Elusimicrobiales bacterium]|jgi:ArsR family transcriptional regulator|nr:NifB/NifX family molybdenum-iron cluster-binding protein [Elusimicrobiales bacterium]
MNICVPVEKNEGLKSKVYGHFGSAPFFAICDTEGGGIEFMDNANLHHEHGQCNPVGALAGRKVGGILVGGIGARALQRLNDSGLKVYRSPQGPLSAALELFKKGELPELTASDCCQGHGCH